MNKININYINSLNEKIIVKDSEQFFKKQIEQLVSDFLKKPKLPKFILVAGPSSSGKTTSSYIIKKSLEKNGINSTVISIDDFFLDRKQTPLLPNGDKDYDSTRAIDWDLFSKVAKSLIENKQCFIPTYDFKLGVKKFSDTPYNPENNNVYIVEGLHALNPIMDSYIKRDLSKKVFVSPMSEFYYDNKKYLDVYKLRFIRRLVRDVEARNITPEKTLKNWPNVRKAEEKYILPYKDLADFKIDSTHPYEPMVYKNIVKDIVKKFDSLNEELSDSLKFFESIKTEKVPSSSLLKEFINNH